MINTTIYLLIGGNLCVPISDIHDIHIYICLAIFTIWMPNVQFAQGRAINFCSATCWNEAPEAAQAPKQHWNVDNHPTAAPGLQHTLS